MFSWRQLLPSWLLDLLVRLFAPTSQVKGITDGKMTNPASPHRILVASYTNSIYTLEFTPATSDSKASLKVLSRLVVGHHPSWITRHATEPSLVFTGLEQSDGWLLALKFDRSTGVGSIVGDFSSGGRDPCTIAVTKDSLLAGNYSSGTVGVYALPSTSADLKELQPPLQFSGTGPNESRQECSHPHQVYPVGDEILVPDLGADKTWRLARTSDGKWEKVGAISYDGLEGGGPRHIGVYDNILYTALELTCKLSAHALSPSTSTSSKLLSSASTLLSPPADVFSIPMLTAELLIASPNSTFKKPFVYVSNRNDPHPEGDTIAIFSTVTQSEPNLKLLSETRTGLNHLRGMIFFGDDDRYLIAGGANGGGIKVFERIGDGSTLQEVAFLGVEAAGADAGEAGFCPTGFLAL